MTHMNVHSGDFQCSVPTCRKAFKSCCLLQGHDKVHSESSDGKKYYDCDYCIDSFEDEKVWLKHVEVSHLTGKSVLCHECGRLFSSKSLLQTHLRLHKNVEYKCEVLESSFSFKH